MSEKADSVLDERLQRREGVLAQEAQGQTVLLRLEDGGYYALDEVGARIWELCDGQRDVGEIVRTLCEEFDAPESTIRADALEFMNDLRRERLLVVNPD
ncbi:MAG: pyrroloquinoline quinone biosynthesis peptide chaperone PqqD [Solirubrobacteraceae bacterium]